MVWTYDHTHTRLTELGPSASVQKYLINSWIWILCGNSYTNLVFETRWNHVVDASQFAMR